jgi:signal transduction histidine kinase
MSANKAFLIIDDDDDDCLLIEERLSDIFGDNCTFVSCYQKAEAIQHLRERTFHLCILDYRLAGYQGTEILDEVVSANLATPIVMLTGQDDHALAENAIKSGAQDFVMKAAIDDDVFEKSVQYAVTRKALEFARTLKEKTEAQNTAKDKFIAHLSHELRTPLTSILGYTSLLLDNPDTEPFQQELGIISNNGKHLLNLLNDVLDLSKIVANKFELKEEHCDLEQTLIETHALVSMNAIEKGLRLEFKCENKLPRYIEHDDIRFRQVLLNLLGNAIKFTDTGAVTASFDFIHDLEPRLIVKVTDTGIGMSDSQASTIFAPFTQVEDVANRKAGGAGLGLSISSEIVKHMGGHFDVESTLGKGSSFTLSLPLTVLERNDEDGHFDLVDMNIEPSSKQQQAAPALSGKVLIVDDVLEIRQLAGHFVKATGVDVHYASNGEQAFEKVESANRQCNPFDLVLMDLHMPVMTGSEAALAIKKVCPTLPIIAMTAAIAESPAKGHQQPIVSNNFDELITKPLNKQILWATLTNYLTLKATKLIHLVEDDADNAQIMQMMLGQLGCEVIVSQSAQDAVENAKHYKNIDHHLLDLGLPDLSGEGFLDAFFSCDANQATREGFAGMVSGSVSILSGNQPEKGLHDKYPIQRQLVKPVSKEELKKLISGD